jgi:DNA repair exonuclease SbcCD nuclease subunit
MIQLLHLSDLHPNASGTFTGRVVVDPATGVNQSLVDLQRSLDFVFQVATDPATRCDAAVLPGDLFDSPRPHMDEVRVVKSFVMALASVMPVICCPGNHDLSQNPQSASALACLTGIPNVYIHETPGTFRLNLREQPVWFSCLPYPSKGRILTQDAGKDASPEAVTAQINQGLATILRGLLVRDGAPGFHVLLAHGSVSGPMQIGTQPRSLAHDIQLPLDELQRFDFVALGHIHQGQRLNEAGTIWYAGSLMRNGFGEELERKGFNLVRLEKDGPHVVFVENPHARRYQTLREMPTDTSLLDPTIVWRFKGDMSPEDYDRMKPALQALETDLPHWQTDIEIRAADRARDAGMAACLTMDEAMRRALSDLPEDAQGTLLIKHHELLEEVQR